jgi:hypothetical protein
MPRLHLLKLHESPILDNGMNYERFHKQWILVDVDKCPQSPSSSSSSSDDKTTTTEKIFPGVKLGDLVWFRDLQTGAGELEGVYCLLKESEQDEQSPSFVLHGCGVEGPEFPPTMAQDLSPEQLRTWYEPLLEKILQLQKLSLMDLFGGKEAVEEFWQSPTFQKAKDPPNKDTWKIPLNRCTWTESYES